MNMTITLYLISLNSASSATEGYFNQLPVEISFCLYMHPSAYVQLRERQAIVESINVPLDTLQAILEPVSWLMQKTQN